MFSISVNTELLEFEVELPLLYQLAHCCFNDFISKFNQQAKEIQEFS